MKFFFSIIIPVYNTEEYLPRCLDSIVSQTFNMMEVQVIIVNDGSPRTEECDKIVELYKDKLQIDYIKLEENKGTHVARKKGIQSVTAEYVVFIDPDDYIKKNALKALYEDIKKNGDTEYIEFDFLQLRWGRFKFKHSCLLPKDATVNMIDMEGWDGGHHCTMFNKCFRTSFIAPLYSEMAEDYIVFAEDFYQICILDYLAKKRRILQEYLYVYVVGTGITKDKIDSKDKIKKILLSCLNIEKHLISFYQKYNDEKRMEKAKQHSFLLYLELIEKSNLEEFIECSRELLNEATLERILLQYLGQTSEVVRASREKKNLKTILGKIKRHLKIYFRR